MKLELKENMHVRTKDGIIAKVDYIDNDTIFFDKELYRAYGDSIDFLEKDNLERIVKASYNIIDILEVGDYVNGKKIVDVGCLTNGTEKGTKVIDYYIAPNVVYYFKNKDIKSVITHEQMEQMAYKVSD